MIAPEMQKVVDWLTDGAPSARTPVALLAETCERLLAAGVPL
jgi:adenylate cyclase